LTAATGKAIIPHTSFDLQHLFKYRISILSGISSLVSQGWHWKTQPASEARTINGIAEHYGEKVEWQILAMLNLVSRSTHWKPLVGLLI